jgi:cytochrome c peroxidase
VVLVLTTLGLFLLVERGGRAVGPPADAPGPLVPLSVAAVPQPANLGGFVRDRTAGVALGKALFWDMQLGSDGKVACASCHFAAGADSRSKNMLSPGVQPKFLEHRPNHQLGTGEFPFHRLADPTDRGSEVLADTDEVAGSAGTLPTVFDAVALGNAVEKTHSPGTDPVFNVGGVNVRRVTGRNAPSVVNAVFNFRNFWDGRAHNEFNGVDPFGVRSPDAKVAQMVAGRPQFVSLTADCQVVNGIPQVRGPLCLTNASLASQAVGPPPNSVEMSADGRTLKDIGRKLAPFRAVGRKLLALRPLGRQFVSPTDGVLGRYARSHGAARGLNVSYASLVRKAFQPRWWLSTMIVRVDPTTGPAFAPYPRRPLAPNEYPVSEYNFALFFGLAIQLYEATLVSDDTPFDHYAGGDANALTQKQQDGLALFFGKAKCASCHGGAAFTNASVANVADEPLETMTMADGEVATYDNGFYNIGVRPTGSDLGVGANDPFGTPLSMTRSEGTAGRIAVDGAFKVPSLRNVALTAPYFHNGGQLTLGQVVDFYNRGGDFHERNLRDLDPDIERLDLTAEERDALVAFLNSLTDDRVRRQKAPFDHPQLFVPHGQRGDETAVQTGADGVAIDDFTVLPAVGAGGGTALPLFPTPSTATAGPPADTEPVAAAVPASVAFGAVARGRAADQPVTVTNVGAAPLIVSAVGMDGANAADFSVVATTCRGASLPKDASCSVTVRFRPRAAGARAAQLTVVHNAVDSPLVIELAGTGR